MTRLIDTERAVSYAKDMSTSESNRINNALDHLGKVS